MCQFADTSIAFAYLLAKKEVLGSKYALEVIQPLSPLGAVSESGFLRELAWVILCGGMAESVVRGVFPAITESFLNWRSAEEISECSKECVDSAMAHFRHKRKIEAIAAGARTVHVRSFPVIRDDILRDPLGCLVEFPFIGPTTVFHLAKNIGVQVAKPDRHLARLALANGFDDVQAFCGCISVFLGEDIRKVDSVLWRFATMHSDYIERFTSYTA
jgi:hypothetical protein